MPPYMVQQLPERTIRIGGLSMIHKNTWMPFFTPGFQPLQLNERIYMRGYISRRWHEGTTKFVLHGKRIDRKNEVIEIMIEWMWRFATGKKIMKWQENKHSKKILFPLAHVSLCFELLQTGEIWNYTIWALPMKCIIRIFFTFQRMLKNLAPLFYSAEICVHFVLHLLLAVWC